MPADGDAADSDAVDSGAVHAFGTMRAALVPPGVRFTGASDRVVKGSRSRLSRSP
jgi:hypothetical protein